MYKSRRYMQSFKLDKGTSTDKQSWFKRHPILSVILVLVGLSIFAGIVSGNSNKPTDNFSNMSQSKPKSKPVQMIGLNTPARDGKFEFTVKSITCGQPSVGSNQYLTKTAQGQYCSLALTVKNIGDKSQTLFSANQKLKNASGIEYSSDDTATMYAAPDSSTWYSDINPGNTVEGVIVFDIPKDQTPVTAVLHDSAYSSGITVKLQ